MSSLEIAHNLDLEQGSYHGSYFSDVDEDEEEENGSCYSQFYSTTAGSYDDYSFSCASDPEIMDSVLVSDSRRVSSVSDYSVEIIENGVVPEIKLHLSKVVVEKICRICHLGLESNSFESGIPIQLGCSCKDDLGAAHKNCAEAWFKIKGDKTCEICQSVARNVAGANETETIEQPNEASNATTATAVSASVPSSETRSLWHGHRFLNFLLACMVFAFVISWLFHFNVPSS